MTSIAFIGLGHMGGPMAANLVGAGHDVRGFDLAGPSLELARQNGIATFPSLAETVSGAGTVITMLPAGKHVLAVWQELVEAVPAGTLLIDCSTIDIDSAGKAHALAAAKGCQALDAPVSGGTGGAAAGTLTFMVGGRSRSLCRRRARLQGDGQQDHPLRRRLGRPGGEDLQ